MQRRHSRVEQRPARRDAENDLFAIPEKYRRMHEESVAVRDSRLYVGIIDDRGMSARSASMQSGVPEVDLGIECVVTNRTRLRNIEATERAKHELLERKLRPSASASPPQRARAPRKKRAA